MRWIEYTGIAESEQLVMDGLNQNSSGGQEDVFEPVDKIHKKENEVFQKRI